MLRLFCDVNFNFVFSNYKECTDLLGAESAHSLVPVVSVEDDHIIDGQRCSASCRQVNASQDLWHWWVYLLLAAPRSSGWLEASCSSSRWLMASCSCVLLYVVRCVPPMVKSSTSDISETTSIIRCAAVRFLRPFLPEQVLRGEKSSLSESDSFWWSESKSGSQSPSALRGEDDFFFDFLFDFLDVTGRLWDFLGRMNSGSSACRPARRLSYFYLNDWS